MVKKALHFLFFIAVSALTLAWYGQTVQQKEDALAEESRVLGAKTVAPYIHSGYEYNWDLYYKGLQAVQQQPPTPLQKTIVGGVVPHHLLQSTYIADMYARLAQQRTVETVIIIGPNHTEAGSFWSLTSDGSWETPDGLVAADKTVIKTLEQSGVIRKDLESVSAEHSIHSQLPFIAHYLPGAKVVPVVLSIYTTQAEIEQLVAALKAVVNDKTAVIASVDFSHFHDSQTAQKNDAQTREMLEKRAYGQLLSLARNADYLDSPASIVTLMQLMDSVDVKSMQILGNTNSGVLLQDSAVPTTSYFEIAFTRE